MYPLNDKDLDRLSRDAAEHYDVESSASGWERLENRLDKELPVKEKDRKRFLFWLFFVALLTGGSLVYMLGRSPAESKLASGKQEAGTVGKVPASAVRDAEKKAGETTVDVQQEKNQQANNPAPAAVDAGKNEPAASSVVKPDAATTKTNDKNIDVKGTNTSSKNKPVVSNTNDRLPKPIRNKTRNLPAAIAADQQDNQMLAKNNRQTTDQSAIDLMKTTMPVIDGEKMYELGKVKKDIPAPPAEVVKKPEVKQDSKLSKWEFGLLTGPDFSNVRFKHNYKTGFNLGLTVGYRISNRLQVNTGLIYTKKFYKANGEDFYPPKHSPPSYWDIIDVKGDCEMFEIPVNLRYDFAYNQKARWFASTGLSSFIVNNQYYDCRYYDNWGQVKEYGWPKDSNYNHVFSHLNFTIGYERSIGKNFSIQAEPYFKLPLKGMGYGGLEMNSYGMFVTFKYKPSVRIKK